MSTSAEREPFDGWPSHTMTWLADLERNNDKPWFEANRSGFDAINAASKSFVAELASTLELSGTPKVWRIYRDQRFSKGEPYKTEHDMGVLSDDGVLHGLRIGPTGVVIAFGIGGVGGMSKQQLAAFRSAVVDPATAVELADRLTELEQLGFELGEPELKRPLKEIAEDHPHPNLSRHKSLFLTKTYDGSPSWLFDAGALPQVVADLAHTNSLRAWLKASLD